MEQNYLPKCENFEELYDKCVKLSDDQITKFEKYTDRLIEELNNASDEIKKIVQLYDVAIEKEYQYITFDTSYREYRNPAFTLKIKGKCVLLYSYISATGDYQELCEQKIDEFVISPKKLIDIIFSLAKTM